MIKMFKCPSFEEGFANGCKYESGIGAYIIDLSPYVYSENTTTYMFAVALSNTNPHNIYTNRLFTRTFICHDKDQVALINWYYESIKKFNDFWCEYIRSVYLEN